MAAWLNRMGRSPKFRAVGTSSGRVFVRNAEILERFWNEDRADGPGDRKA